MQNEIRVGSLFSGIGGIELGFERVGGFRTEWFIESEKYPQQILRERFPRTHVYGDITQIDFGKVPRVEVLTGGFPCQDISNAGKRAGITGSRSSLWSYFVEAIRVLRPRFVLAENVSALTQRGLDTVLCDLASIGYDAEWYCVPASSVGANHRRDRIFILAYPDSSGQLHRESEEQSAEARKYAQREPEPSSKYVSDTDKQRLQRDFTEEQGGRQPQKESGWRGFWSVEPGVGRVADGVPNRVDRIKALGNAVVPQVAQVFAEAIKEQIRKEGGSGE